MSWTGATKAAGAVCAASWPANPVRAALAVAGLARNLSAPVSQASVPSGPGRADAARLGGGGDVWRPLLLAGAGADRLAEAAGLTSMTTSGRSVGRTAAKGSTYWKKHRGHGWRGCPR